MKKYLAISAITIGLLSTASLNAAENIEEMFQDAKVSGQIRMFHVDREYQGTRGYDAHRDATAIGGHLKFITDEYNGVKLGVAGYTTNGIFTHSPKDDFSQNDMTLLGHRNESYTMLGEAYVEYNYKNTTFQGGRVQFHSPMMNDDDARMILNLFEAYSLTNTDIKNTTLKIAHVTRFAQGTFGRVYNAAGGQAGAILSATSGYSAVNSRPEDSGEFQNVGTYAVGKSTDGITVASIVYKKDNLKLQLWDDYAHDIVNTLYGELNFSWNCLLNDEVKPFIGVQFIKQNDVGDSLINHGNGFSGDGGIDSFYLAAKLGVKYKGFTAYVAYSDTTSNSEQDMNEGGYSNAIITTWGGMPAYTQGMVERHQFLAGTKATKIAGGYSFKEHGVDLTASAYYATFKMDKYSGYGKSRTATEPGFDFTYYPKFLKKLQLRFRGNFPRNFNDGATGSTGWSEYRFITNYTF